MCVINVCNTTATILSASEAGHTTKRHPPQGQKLQKVIKQPRLQSYSTNCDLVPGQYCKHTPQSQTTFPHRETAEAVWQVSVCPPSFKTGTAAPPRQGSVTLGFHMVIPLIPHFGQIAIFVFVSYLSKLVYWVGFGTVLTLQTHL